jgi:Flp pilus assembly protein TadD
MWKWLIGLFLIGGLLVCAGGLGGSGWWYWQRLQVERQATEAAQLARVQQEEAANALTIATAARSDALAIARAAVAAGDDRSAIDAFGEVLDGEPQNVEALLGRGRALARLERTTEAETDLRALVQLQPDNAEALEALAWVLGRSGQDAEAVTTLDALIKLTPNDPKAYRDRANAAFRAGNLPEARADAARSCALGLTEGCALEERLRAVRR